MCKCSSATRSSPQSLYERRVCIPESMCGRADEDLPVSDVLSCCTA